MTAVFNEPNLVFVVNAILPSNRVHETFKIAQRLPAPGRERERQRVENQVNEHLDRLATITGLEYLVIYAGNPEMAQAILEAERDCPF